MNKNLSKGRAWLNPIAHDDTGAVSHDAFVETYSDKKDAKIYFEGELVIRDCSRQVNLSFSAYNKKTLKQRQKKVKILIEQLEKIDQALTTYEQDYMSL